MRYEIWIEIQVHKIYVAYAWCLCRMCTYATGLSWSSCWIRNTFLFASTLLACSGNEVESAPICHKNVEKPLLFLLTLYFWALKSKWIKNLFKSSTINILTEINGWVLIQIALVLNRVRRLVAGNFIFIFKIFSQQKIKCNSHFLPKQWVESNSCTTAFHQTI